MKDDIILQLEISGYKDDEIEFISDAYDLIKSEYSKNFNSELPEKELKRLYLTNKNSNINDVLNNSNRPDFKWLNSCFLQLKQDFMEEFSHEFQF